MMSHLTLCRVCLAGNVKIHWIRDTPLQALYEKLTSYKLSTKDERPETICYNCLAQLQRYRRFHNKSQKSQEILTKLAENGIEIYKDTVAILNRGIQHDYSITDIELYSCPKYDNINVKQENVSIKEENITYNLNIENGETLGFIAEPDAVLCVVCLIGDVKTCSIKNTPLQVVYERLTNSKITAMRIEMVCYMCHWQLIKCRRFINKSKKSESILMELLRNGVQLSQATVALLNSQIKTNLESAPVETTSYHSPDKPREKSPETQENTDTTDSGIDIFECDKCNYKTKSLNKYNNHLERHNTKWQFSCDICGYRYEYPGGLGAHKRKVHRNNFKCKKCDSQFANKRQLNTHMYTHTANSDTCEKCNITFKNRFNLRKHNRRLHSLDKYPCTKCNSSFITKRFLSEHIIKMHTIHFPFYTCDVCDRSFSEKSRLRKHMKFVHLKIRKFKCDICGKLWGTKTTLNEHLLFHAKIRSYKCSICHKTYRYRTTLQVHMKSHSKIKPYKCSYCNKTFSYEATLKEHSISHNKLICDICNKEFSSKWFLREHIQNHMSGLNKTYNCVECGKSYPLKAQLKIHMYRHMNKPKVVPFETCQVCNKQTRSLLVHMRVHTGEKPFSCKCGKSYTSVAALRQHQKKSFTNGQLYECTICGKFFKSKRYLKIHGSLHSGVKPYSCKECGNSYTHKEKLYNHMRSHRDKVKFPCQECSKTFLEKRSLDNHVIVCHQDEKQPTYACDMCFKVYLDKKGLITHLKTHKKTKPFTCNGYNCKKAFSTLSVLGGHAYKHKKDKIKVCWFCKKVLDCGSVARHYITKHGGLKPYSCNNCDETFVNFRLAYHHYVGLHNKVDPFSCERCDKHYTRARHLREHVQKMHTEQ